MIYTRPDGRRRVVVTGGGICSSLGDSWEEAKVSLKALKNKTRYIPDWEKFDRMNTRLAAPYEKDIPVFPRKKIRGMGRVALLSLCATEKALASATLLDADGNAVEEISNGRCGIAYGSCMGNIDSLLEMTSMLVSDDPSRISSQSYIKCMPQTCAVNLSIFYGIKGRIITTNSACTSGSQAIGYSYEAISFGLQDIMICGGAEELAPPDAAAFDVMAATAVQNDSPETEPKPFDANRDGLVIGEGASTIILEDLEHAVKRGAKIYAEVAGYGTNCDGCHITHPDVASMARCLELALKDAGISSDEIGYVNAHGTSTPTGDVAECEATYSVFKRPVPISSTKSYTGHTLGACGCLESWLSINMMNEGWFHPTLNLSNIDENCQSLGHITNDIKEIDTDYVMTNNFAFGGVNTSLIFKKYSEK